MSDPIFEVIEPTLTMPTKLTGAKRGTRDYQFDNGEIINIPLAEEQMFLAEHAKNISNEMEDILKAQRELYRWSEQLNKIKALDLEQNSWEWLLARLGNISGSANPFGKDGKIKLDSTKKKLPYQKAAEAIYRDNADEEFVYMHKEFNSFGGNFATKRGHDLEPVIRKQFLENHPEFNNIEVGLAKLNLVPFLHYSPDDLLQEGLECNTLLEIKSMDFWKFLLVQDDHQVLVDEYYSQIQLGMFLFDLDKCYLVAGYERCENIEILVERDEMFIFNMVRELNWLLPRIEEIYQAKKDIFRKL